MQNYMVRFFFFFKSCKRVDCIFHLNFLFIQFTASQEEATMKRIKLEYDDICSYAKENTEVWETILDRSDRKFDDQMLLQAMKRGTFF